jgi:hypothetical protein
VAEDQLAIVAEVLVQTQSRRAPTQEARERIFMGNFVRAWRPVLMPADQFNTVLVEPGEAVPDSNARPAVPQRRGPRISAPCPYRKPKTADRDHEIG